MRGSAPHRLRRLQLPAVDRPRRHARSIPGRGSFIGVAEVLGALGLILPGLLRIRPGLTPLAAAGLAVIMTGATVVTLAIGPAGGAVVPLVVGLLAAFVVHGRWQRTTARREPPAHVPAGHGIAPLHEH